MKSNADICVLISAGAEWRGFLPHFNHLELISTPFGEYFEKTINRQRLAFLHGGSGKVAAAGSTQYAIDRWSPKRLINFGTCGGFSGMIDRGKIILAQKTIIYDILEQMSDQDQAIDRYAVTFDLSWLPEKLPQEVILGTLLSADRDILPGDIPSLIHKYHASVADWESGAIAWIAHRNQIPVLILRTVSDLVSPEGGEAYGDYEFFETQCQSIMANFADHLPQWLELFHET